MPQPGGRFSLTLPEPASSGEPGGSSPRITVGLAAAGRAFPRTGPSRAFGMYEAVRTASKALRSPLFLVLALTRAPALADEPVDATLDQDFDGDLTLHERKGPP